MKKTVRVLLSILSGVLLCIAWPPGNLTFLVFFAFVPLLIITHHTTKRPALFGYVFLSMLIWNSGTTWWIWNSTAEGAISAILANSMIMCLPWMGYHIALKRFTQQAALCSLLSFWMLFEYVHLNWQLSWPWLNLGNIFSAQTNWIQWYEFTGIGGGTLWILLLNIFIFLAFIQTKKIIPSSIAILLFLLPIGWSKLLQPFFIQPIITSVPRVSSNVIIVQPNIDPYKKFEEQNAAEQIQQLISLSEKEIDSATQLVIWPETALPVTVLQNEFENKEIYAPVFAFVHRHPQLSLLTGIETWKSYGTTKATYSAKLSNGIYYDAFNAAVSIHANKPLQFYNKSKLVPGVETLPAFLNVLAPVFEKFGGTTGGYGQSDSSIVFKHDSIEYITAPIICYESIYGEYVGSYVQKGANLLTIITNDGWWGNTNGHKQHLLMAKLRAIETRHWVARSANTGISAVIDPYGKILEEREWDKAAALKFYIPSANKKTWYTQYGDYIYKLFSVIASVILCWMFLIWLKKKMTRKNPTS